MTLHSLTVSHKLQVFKRAALVLDMCKHSWAPTDTLRSVIGGFVFELFGNVDDSGSFDKIYVVAILLVLLNFVGLFLDRIISGDCPGMRLVHCTAPPANEDCVQHNLLRSVSKSLA